MKKSIFYILISFLFLAFSCKNNGNQEIKDNVIYVKTENVGIKNLPTIIHGSGRLSAMSETKLSFKSGGIINSILASEGQKVSKGQVLAELKFDEIYAHVKKARLGYEKAKRDFMRAESLYKDSVATLEQYQDAKTALEVAESNVKIAEFNLEHSKIIAPANGVILKKLAEKNEIIAQGYPVLLFQTSENEWIVRLSVVDREIVQIQQNDKAIIKMDAYPGKTFDAFVSETGSMADPYTGTFEVELTMVNPDKGFINGFIASVDIICNEQKKYFLVPVNALLVGNENTAYVYAVRDSIPEKIKIHFSHFDEQFLYVTHGVNENEKVITDGAKYITNYTKISILN